MGQVYKARHKVMKRVVALKTLPPAATEVGAGRASGSTARSRRPPGCRIPTSSPPTTPARTTASTSW